PFSTMATHEFVVPRSMPMTFSIRGAPPGAFKPSSVASAAEFRCYSTARTACGRTAQRGNKPATVCPVFGAIWGFFEGGGRPSWGPPPCSFLQRFQQLGHLLVGG